MDRDIHFLFAALASLMCLLFAALGWDNRRCMQAIEKTFKDTMEEKFQAFEGRVDNKIQAFKDPVEQKFARIDKNLRREKGAERHFMDGLCPSGAESVGGLVARTTQSAVT